MESQLAVAFLVIGNAKSYSVRNVLAVKSTLASRPNILTHANAGCSVDVLAYRIALLRTV